MTSNTPRRTRMKDVAEKAAVSPSTVSFVLAGRSDMRIPESTRQRVLRAARELNYRPNLMARSLRTSVSSTIGLVSNGILTEPYAGDLIRGALATAHEHEQLLVVIEAENDRVTERRLVQELVGRQVDGFVYATLLTSEVTVPRELAGHPLVLLNCWSSARTPAILPDEVQGGARAANALLAAGHRQGIFIVGETPADVLPAQGRRAGVESALITGGAELGGVIECPWWPGPAYDAMTAFLRGQGRPSALICMNDRITLGVYQALATAGLAIPEDVSLVSFDDSDLARWLRPQVTSVAMPYAEMGGRAVEALLSTQRLDGPQRISMPLHERASVAPFRG
jgi:LacI family transcriptional regulator